MMNDCIYRDALLKDIEENVVFSGQTPNAEIVGANKVVSRIKAAPVADTDSEWISVEDRLPEEDGRVLAYFPDMAGSDCEIQISKAWALNKFVSHWMPLPNPPKGQKVGCSK